MGVPCHKHRQYLDIWAHAVHNHFSVVFHLHSPSFKRREIMLCNTSGKEYYEYLMAINVNGSNQKIIYYLLS